MHAGVPLSFSNARSGVEMSARSRHRQGLRARPLCSPKRSSARLSWRPLSFYGALSQALSVLPPRSVPIADSHGEHYYEWLVSTKAHTMSNGYSLVGGRHVAYANSWNA